eukprot:Nk52_evm34s2657 gene=Nk52_evmTU34s2657
MRSSSISLPSRFSVVLFYKYVVIEDVEEFAATIKALCQRLNLDGRVIVSGEGINGSLSCESEEGIDKFCSEMERDSRFPPGSVDWKRSKGTEETAPFPDLVVKIKKEIVSSNGVRAPFKGNEGGVHLTPEEFHEALTDALKPENRDEIAILDVRNQQEVALGCFEGAEDPKTRTFAEWSRYAESRAEELKEKKKVLMYCTGGIRCEKASLLLKDLGIEEIYQLKGGIHRYLEKFGSSSEDGVEQDKTEAGLVENESDSLWKGKNFVFDRRLVQPVEEEPVSKVVVGQCESCGVAWEKMIGCTVCAVCRDQLLVCDKCCEEKKYQLYCWRHSFLEGIYFYYVKDINSSVLKKQNCLLRRMLKESGVLEKEARRLLKKNELECEKGDEGKGEDSRQQDDEEAVEDAHRRVLPAQPFGAKLPVGQIPPNGLSKNQRRTISKQIRKIEEELKSRGVDEKGMITEWVDASQILVGEDNGGLIDGPHCRSGGKLLHGPDKCNGLCWGFFGVRDLGTCS